MVLRVQLIKNVFSSWFAYGVRLVISFFFIPFITGVLGDTRYGIWVIIFQTINYLSLLDIGFEKALVRYLSKFLGHKNYQDINRVISTAAVIYLIIGTLAIITVWLVANYFFGYFKINDPELLAEGRAALIIIGFYLGFRFYLFPMGGTLGAFQRYDLANFLNIIEELLKTLVMVWLLYNGYGLIALALVIFISTVLKLSAGAIWLKRLHPAVTFKPGLADRATAHTLFTYSKISFGITIAWIIIFNTDVVLLGLLSSSAAAGIYAPGAQLMLYLRHIINAIGIPLTPAVSQLESTTPLAKIGDIYLKSVKYISYLSFFIAVGTIIYARSFVGLWLEPEFAQAARVMIILAAGSAFFLPQIIGNYILFGIEKHKYLLYVLICEAVIKIVLSFILIQRYGLVGMALAAVIPQILLYITIYPYFMARVLKLPLARIMINSLSPGILALVISIPAGLLTKYLIPVSGWGTFFINISVVTAIVALPGWFVIDAEDRRMLVNFIRPGRKSKL